MEIHHAFRHMHKQFRGAVGKIMVTGISKVTSPSKQLEKMTKAINIVLLN
jgi:hypothetical protein